MGVQVNYFAESFNRIWIQYYDLKADLFSGDKKDDKSSRGSSSRGTSRSCEFAVFLFVQSQ